MTAEVIWFPVERRARIVRLAALRGPGPPSREPGKLISLADRRRAPDGLERVGDVIVREPGWFGVRLRPNAGVTVTASVSGGPPVEGQQGVINFTWPEGGTA